MLGLDIFAFLVFLGLINPVLIAVAIVAKLRWRK